MKENRMVSVVSDIGSVKKVNQDAALYKEAETEDGPIVFAAVCDGMGGLHDGEVASASVITSLGKWFEGVLPGIMRKGFGYKDIIRSLNRVVVSEDEAITAYGEDVGDCGTTLAGILIYQGKYLCINIGDSRVYRLTDSDIQQLTHDQTVVQQMIDNGSLSIEEAKTHPERNVLLQCIGAGGDVVPEYTKGSCKMGDVFLVCSDGFRHTITEDEMRDWFCPEEMDSEKKLNERALEAVETCKERGERDNISVLVCRMQ